MVWFRFMVIGLGLILEAVSLVIRLIIFILGLISFLLREGVLLMIRFYRTFISPYTPRTCRFYPTCSAYSEMAIRKYGLLWGGAKSAWRILRCNPFSKGGIDYP